MLVALARVVRRWAHRLPPPARLAVVRLVRRAPWPPAVQARLREVARASTYPPPSPPDAPAYGVAPHDPAFAAWAARQPPAHAVASQAAVRLAALRRRPRISVLMPVHDPDPWTLEQALRSVQAQLYPHWELCLADDASRDPRVRAVLDAQAAAHPDRVRLVRLPERRHRVEATNAALGLATGEFAAFLDHDDVLTPEALLEVAAVVDEDPGADVVYSDHDVLGPDGLRRHPQFKPDWCPELLLSYMYIGHLRVYRTSLVREAGGLRGSYEGAADYELALRLTERTQRVRHVPRILYHRRAAPPSTAPDARREPEGFESGRRALQEALRRRGIPAQAEWPSFARRTGIGVFHVRFDPAPEVPVTIVIPTRDRVELLRSCIASIEEKTTHRTFEIVILDNDSREAETLDYLRRSPHRVVTCPGPFNFAALANRGAREASTEHFVLLNNDTRVIEEAWLDELLGWGRLPGVGAVGAKLLYPDGRIQHAGVLLGIQGLAGHAFQPRIDDDSHLEYCAYAHVARNYLAVTGACMLTTQTAFAAVEGFNERDLKVGWNDVDYCLRLRERGYRAIFTPWARLAHLESQSRGDDKDPAEVRYMLRRWKSYLERDPMYNPNLSRKDGLFTPQGEEGEERSFFYGAYHDLPAPTPRPGLG